MGVCSSRYERIRANLSALAPSFPGSVKVSWGWLTVPTIAARVDAVETEQNADIMQISKQSFDADLVMEMVETGGYHPQVHSCIFERNLQCLRRLKYLKCLPTSLGTDPSS